MKKLLVLAALSMAAAPAMASKARMSALSNSAQLIDIQTSFVNPADLMNMGGWATFEMGQTNATNAVNSPNAEAGFARAAGDSRWGFYMGHTGVATSVRGTVNGAIANDYLIEENAINLFYAAKMGEINWGVNVNYSNSDQKTAGKQSAMGVAAGMRAFGFDASLGLGLSDTATFDNGAGTVDQKWTGKMPVDLRGGYTLDAWYFYGKYAMWGGKHEDSVAAANDKDYENSDLMIGFTNSTKVDGGEFFWGAGYDMMSEKEKKADTKTETQLMPVVIGIEADAASWLVLRGSITQNVLLSSVKVNGGSATTKANNTVVAAGAGVKFNKFMLDATLSAADGTAGNAGKIDSDSLLANASLTYMF